MCYCSYSVILSKENKRPWRFEITSSLISGLHTTVILQPDVYLPLGHDRLQWDYHVLTPAEEHTWKLCLIWHKNGVLVRANSSGSHSCNACCQKMNKHDMKRRKKKRPSVEPSLLHMTVCAVRVATPQSPHCGAPVGEQHWETSAGLGWTGPSAGLIASPHAPAATQTHTHTLQ